MTNGNNKKKVLPKNRLAGILKGLVIYILIGLAALVFVIGSSGNLQNGTPVPISQIIADSKEGKVQKIELQGDKIVARYKDNKLVTSRKEEGESIYKILEVSGVDPKTVEIDIKDTSWQQALFGVLGSLLPILIMGVVLFFIFRQAREAGQSVFSFGQSRARLFSKDQPHVKFTDVAGSEEAKKELSEVVDFLKSPGKYKEIGARTPKGVLLVGPPGVGKCVTGDTIIWTNKGLMEIRDIPRYYYVDPKTHFVFGAELASFNIDDIYSENRFASHWHDLGEQETLKIKLKQGFELEGTPEHPVVVITRDGQLRFRHLKQLLPGDNVAIQYGRELFGNLDLVDEETAYLMGLLTGDGNLSQGSRVELTNIDPGIVGYFKTYLKRNYPISKVGHRVQTYTISSWQFKKFLHEAGMSYLLSYDKQIPPTILQAPKHIQVAFLQGLFDTDASVGGIKRDFEYSTVSKKMANQVHMMLLNLGVVSTLNTKNKKDNYHPRNVYRISLMGDSLVEFEKLVGFRLSRKHKLLTGHVAKMRASNTNIDIIPNIAYLFSESWEAVSDCKLSNSYWANVADKIRDRGRVSRQMLKRYIEFASQLDILVPHLEYFRSLLEAKLFFSPVVEINQSRARVFDFTVPRIHSFLGNGFVNHNTLLARAVAGEANVPFFSIAGSEFMEILVGVGASRVRDLFSQAKKSAPSIIFIDEIESIGRMRGMGISGGHDEREQTLNQILVEMDGFTPNEAVIVISATNRPELLDPALVRPGRFDRRVVLTLPDLEERKALIELYMKGKPFASDVNVEKLARRTVSFSGADIANVLNEAAILAAREDKKAIDSHHLEEAATKLKLGPARKRMQSEEDRKLAAYHEAGHAVVGHFSKNIDPVHRISIVSRGVSGGHTMFPPTQDRTNETKSRLLDNIATALGGQAAEKMIFADFSTGAASDLEVATAIARAMVMEYGMSNLGPITTRSRATMMGANWLSPMESSDASPQLSNQIDKEVKKILDYGMKRAAELLKKNKAKFEKVAKTLLEKETLESEEFEKIVGKKSTAA